MHTRVAAIHNLKPKDKVKMPKCFHSATEIEKHLQQLGKAEFRLKACQNIRWSKAVAENRGMPQINYKLEEQEKGEKE